jgi:hypothetical protein
MKMTDDTFAKLQDFTNLCACCDDYHDAIIRLAGDNTACSVMTLLDSYRQAILDKDRMFQAEIKPLGYQDSFDACIAYNREQSIRNLR